MPNESKGALTMHPDSQNQSPPRPDTPTTLDRLFLTAGEVADELGLKKSRVYELAACGMLPVVRLGRRTLFPPRGLDILIDDAIERARSRLGLDERDENCAAVPFHHLSRGGHS